MYGLGLHIPEGSGRYLDLGGRHEICLPLLGSWRRGGFTWAAFCVFWGVGWGWPRLIGERGTDQDGTEILWSLWVHLARRG